jgi:hypothetical protein
MLKQLIPALGNNQSLLGGEMGTIKKCFELRLPDGCQVVGFVAYDSGLGAAIKVNVNSAHGEDLIANELAEAFRGLLEERGAQPLEAIEAV